MKVFKKRSVWCLLTAWVAVWLIIAIIAGVVTTNYVRPINQALGLAGFRTETIVPENGEKIDSEYYKSAFVKKDENGNILYNDDGMQIYDDAALHKADVEIADRVQREGAAILWNESKSGDKGLPLAKNAAVSLFGHSSVAVAYSGSGSGSVYAKASPTMKAAFESAGLSVNDTLWNFYMSKAIDEAYSRTEAAKINEVPYSKYTDDVKSSFAAYGDAAIFVLTRVSGEKTDFNMKGADTDTGDYLSLSNQELNVLSQIVLLKRAGVFDKVIILLNTPGQINFAQIYDTKTTSRFAQYSGLSGCLADYVDCCMWIGQPGNEGLNEVGRILTGASYPSGHIVNTFAMDNKSAPAASNARALSYLGSSGRTFTGSSAERHTSYIVYAEGIYVGYKYYETRYEDAVMNEGKALSTAGTFNSSGNWNYAEEVAFPFGWGESYTTFSYDCTATENDVGGFDVTVTVTNTGEHAGMDAVQVYIQKPYTEFDKEHGLEQASVNLCGYAKTGEIQPGKTETVTITVDGNAFKTYDHVVNKTYIREKGTYYVTVAQNAHDAVNNILAKKGYTKVNGMDKEGDVDCVWTKKYVADDLESYSHSANNASVSNRFDEANWNTYSHKGDETVTYLSRKDWEATYPSARITLTMTDGLYNDVLFDYDVERDPKDKMPVYGADNGMKLADMRGLDIDNPYWDSLLDQMTLEEQINMIGLAYHGSSMVESITKPGEDVQDGPLGYRSVFKTDSSLRTMGFPSTVVLAATFNDELAEKVGTQIGEDALHAGISGLYGPGANIQRTAYGGRNFEYYSEDPFVSGRMLKSEVQGIQTSGTFTHIKHFLLNDQDSQRYGVSIWLNEQTIRETYLEAFRPAVEEGKSRSVMTSFNRIGAKWSGAVYGLCTEVLRDEWGFVGPVISDCPCGAYMGVVDGLMAGNDFILYASTNLDAYYAAETNPTVAQAIRTATRRVLYMVANSNAMNGYSTNTRVYPVKEWWQHAITGVTIGLGVLTGILAAMTVTSFVYCSKTKKKVSAEKNDRRDR